MKNLFAISGAVALCALATTSAFLPSTANASDTDELLLKTGDSAPPFSMRDLDGNPFSLADHVGPGAASPRKAVFIVFFATWCEPCKKEIPIIKKVHGRWAKLGLEVVYIGLSQSAKDLKPFVGEVKMPWRVVPDSFGLLSRRYGASQLPHVLLINTKSQVAWQHRGIAPDLQRTIETQVSKATGVPVPAGLDGAPAEAKAVEPRFSKNMSMGRIPSADGAAARWQPLASYLGEAVSANMSIESATTYMEFEKKMRAGEFDVANVGPLLSLELKKLYVPIAQLERLGTPHYLGIVFAKRSSELGSLKDLKGKKLGLVSPKSTSGGLYPQKALLDEGLIPGKDVEIVWLDSHSKVAAAVRDGKVDAGACYEDCRDSAYPDLAAKNAETKILAYTSQIPAEMVVIKRSLDRKTKDALRKALLGLNESEGMLQQLSQKELAITKVTPADDKALAPVARVKRQVKRRTKKGR